jgi:hypothetical protein
MAGKLDAELVGWWRVAGKGAGIELDLCCGWSMGGA